MAEMPGLCEGGWEMTVEEIIEELCKLSSDEERLDVIYLFCTHCGCYEGDRGICQCWNDE